MERVARGDDAPRQDRSSTRASPARASWRTRPRFRPGPGRAGTLPDGTGPDLARPDLSGEPYAHGDVVVADDVVTDSVDTVDAVDTVDTHSDIGSDTVDAVDSHEPDPVQVQGDAVRCVSHALG